MPTLNFDVAVAVAVAVAVVVAGLGRCLHCFKAKCHYSQPPYPDLPPRSKSFCFWCKARACLLLCMSLLYTSIC